MIALLKGRLVEKHPNRLIVDVGGVGYDVQVPLSTFYDLAEPGTEITLRIHTHVREDLIALYGFGTALELALFDRLLGVNGVGPKLALAIAVGHRAARTRHARSAPPTSRGCRASRASGRRPPSGSAWS